MTDGGAPSPSRALRGAAVLADPLVRELLGRRLVAVLSTLEPDGSVFSVPMWLAAERDALLLATSGTSRKVRNLERDARATVTVHDSRPGYEVCGVAVQGTVELVHGAAAVPLVRAVHARYLAPAAERLEQAAAFLASDDVAVRVRPLRAWTWDERSSEAAVAVARAGVAFPLEPTTSALSGEERLHRSRG